jgi:cell division septum initiation protein DivIVA
MENTDIEKKIKDLKEFIKQKTDQGTANYLGKEIREICGMVETEQSSITAVVQAKPEVCEHKMELCYSNLAVDIYRCSKCGFTE